MNSNTSIYSLYGYLKTAEVSASDKANELIIVTPLLGSSEFIGEDHSYIPLPIKGILNIIKNISEEKEVQEGNGDAELVAMP